MSQSDFDLDIDLPSTSVPVPIRQGPIDLFSYTTGPRDAKILIVGEHLNSEEKSHKTPFTGPPGKEMRKMLQEAGIDHTSVLFTVVVPEYPPSNRLEQFILPTKGNKDAIRTRGLLVDRDVRKGLEDLYSLIDLVKPKLIIAAGNLAFWALSSKSGTVTHAGYKLPTGIASWRGSQIFSDPIKGNTYPLLPIFTPSSIFKEWSHRALTVHDLSARAAAYIKRGYFDWYPGSKTKYLASPNYKDVRDFFSRCFELLDAGPLYLSVDIETYRRRYMSVVGLATKDLALCIPFFHIDNSNVINYWPISHEIEIFRSLKLLLEHPNIRIIGQNFIYDTQYFNRFYNINAIVSLDTMVMHHLLFPGTPKSLDRLASLYCENYVYWKDESTEWDLDPESAKKLWLYNCQDTDYTFEIAMVLEEALKGQGKWDLYLFQMKQWKIARRMMLRGILFDKSEQSRLRADLYEQANELSNWLMGVVPSEFQYSSTGTPWYDSPTATAKFLYGALALDPVLHKKTKRPTTDYDALDILANTPSNNYLIPLFERLQDLRSIGVIRSNFLEARVGVDGRMRCTFNIAHPETFRWSSSANGFEEGTNLQNIPKS